jgi:hypothetical protein
LDLTGNAKPRLDLEARRKISFLELHDVRPDVPVTEHPESINDLALLYDVDVNLLYKYNTYLSGWNWGEPLDPDWAFELVQALIRVDLG